MLHSRKPIVMDAVLLGSSSPMKPVAVYTLACGPGNQRATVSKLP